MRQPGRAGRTEDVVVVERPAHTFHDYEAKASRRERQLRTRVLLTQVIASATVAAALLGWLAYDDPAPLEYANEPTAMVRFGAQPVDEPVLTPPTARTFDPVPVGDWLLEGAVDLGTTVQLDRMQRERVRRGQRRNCARSAFIDLVPHVVADLDHSSQ